MDYFGRVMELWVTVILLFLVPLCYMSARNEMLCQTYVTTETTYFVDSVRNIGFVDKQMYETFIKKLAVTHIPYEIKMSHYKAKLKGMEEQLENAPEEEMMYMSYYEGVYHSDILEEILESERYYFHKGDFFSVSVQKQGRTWGDRLWDCLIGVGQEMKEIQVVYGGSIRDESN